MKKPVLLILGLGFGGMYTYKSLSATVRRHYDVVVVDRHNYFLFTPLLHEVATGSLESHHVVEPLKRILNPQDTFIQDTVISVDPEENIVELKEYGTLSFDTIVMGLGSRTNFFDTPRAEEKSFDLKTLHDAEILRRHIIQTFQKASLIEDREERKKTLSMVVIGGGPTGVEFAGELADLCFRTLVPVYPSIDTKDISIVLANGGATLLKPFSTSSQAYAQHVLRDKGVKVRNGLRINELLDGSVMTQDGEEIDASTVVWAAGVRPQVVSDEDVFEHNRDRLLVNKYLQAQEYYHVFVLGDMALAPTSDERGYPMLAQVAKQQGVQTAKNLERLILGQDLEPFNYTSRGTMASLGHLHGIVEVGGLHIRGMVGWFIWRSVYLFNFPSWNKRIKIMLDWAANLFLPRDITDTTEQ